MAAAKSMVIDAVKREYERWRGSRPAETFSTGYAGKGFVSAETALKNDFEEAAVALKSDVGRDLGHAYTVKVEESFTGAEHGEAGIFIWQSGVAHPVFNFHMRLV